MGLKLLSVASIFACLTLAVFSGKFTERFTLLREGFRLNDGNITDEYTSTSQTACISICGHLSWCVTASYSSDQGRCLLGTVRVTDDELAKKLLMTEANWITMSKAFYKVFRRTHSNGRYQLSYTEGITMCNEKNTVVASEADLLASRALGFGSCDCGWLSNGKNGMVIHFRDPACWPLFNKVVIYCNHVKADVWCRL